MPAKVSFLTICYVILPISGIFRRAHMLLVLLSQRNMYRMGCNQRRPFSLVSNLNVQMFHRFLCKKCLNSVSDLDPELDPDQDPKQISGSGS
jgi:hypothetical protein